MLILQLVVWKRGAVRPVRPAGYFILSFKLRSVCGMAVQVKTRARIEDPDCDFNGLAMTRSFEITLC